MNDLLFLIIIASGVLMLLAVGFMVIVSLSSRTIIKEQQEKIASIKKQEEHYKALFDNSMVGMVRFSPEHLRVLDVNRSLLEKLELSTAEEFQKIFHRFIGQAEEAMWAGLLKEKEFRDCEIEFTTASGVQRIFHFSGKVTGADKGEERSVHTVLTDITDRKRLEASFIRAQKMESLSILTNSIVHDLRNIFAPIQLSLKLLEQKVRSHSAAVIVSAAKKSAKQGEQLVESIVSIARGGKGEFKRIHLNSLLRSILSAFDPGKGNTLVVTNLLKKEDPVIIGNAEQLRQMFLNLLRNGRESIRIKGKITFRVERSVTMIVFTVSDNGIGIPPEMLSNVFEPFFTTKQNSGGLGLGLSMVAEIVKRHSGTIAIHSGEGKGTEITVTLPESAEEAS